MIVCSLPRCGATKYCLDLQHKTGLKFIGELNPIYIQEYGDTVKREHHETNFQPNYTKEEYIEALCNHDKMIVLANQSPHLLVPQCDRVVLRKNMRNSFLSLANFFIKCRPYLKSAGIIQHLFLTFQSYYGVLCYLSRHEKPIVWYEDYFGINDTTTPLLDAYPFKRVIIDQIDGMFKSNDCNELLDNIRQRHEKI